MSATSRPRAPWRRLARALGVTRVARVTGHDRTGIEVACAVRPGGHVLQVTNGKGLTFAEAAAGALLEAAELAAAERVPASALRWASAGELRRGGATLVWPGGAADPDRPIAWRVGRDVGSGRPLLVPAAAVHVPASGAPLLGLAGVRWTSNGMGAHFSRPRALLHALLEAVERDTLARALPAGWTERAVAARRVGDDAVRSAAPALAALAGRVEARGFEVHLFDLGQTRPDAGPRGLPVAGALLFDREQGPLPLTAGYACRLDPAAALLSALLEAAQSRLTDIHGAREDVAAGPGDGVEELRAACGRARARHPARRSSLLRPSSSSRRTGAAHPRRALRAVLARLRAGGHLPAAVVDLAGPELGVHVVKVVAPGLLLSELL